MQCQLIFYCDLDGVLTDFENHLLKEIPQVLPPNPTWTDMPAFDSIGELRQHLGSDWYKMTANLPQSFWEFMPWLSDGRLLWDFLGNYPRIILSTPASSRFSRIGKLRWVERELGLDTPNIIQPYKSRYVKQNLAVPSIFLRKNLSKILIDDLDKNVDSWVAQGGIGILHKSAETTIKRIQEIKASISI